MVPGWARRVRSRLGGWAVDLVPHIALAAHLESQRMLTEVASVRWDVPLEVIHALMRGGYPEDTAHLARIGRAIQADAETWGWALTAGLCRLSRADAERCLRGRLWRWLIREELGIAEAAKRHGITTRSLRLALSDTAVTGSLRQSGILAAVEWSDEREAVRERPEAVELRQLVGAAMAKGGWTRRRLSAEVGASRASIAALTRGQVPRVLNPLWVRPLARALGIDPGRFAHLLAALWRTRSSNRGAVRHRVSLLPPGSSTCDCRLDTDWAKSCRSDWTWPALVVWSPPLVASGAVPGSPEDSVASAVSTARSAGPCASAAASRSRIGLMGGMRRMPSGYGPRLRAETWRRSLGGDATPSVVP